MNLLANRAKLIMALGMATRIFEQGEPYVPTGCGISEQGVRLSHAS